jgi:hypothetical protein
MLLSFAFAMVALVALLARESMPKPVKVPVRAR